MDIFLPESAKETYGEHLPSKTNEWNTEFRKILEVIAADQNNL